MKYILVIFAFLISTNSFAQMGGRTQADFGTNRAYEAQDIKSRILISAQALANLFDEESIVFQPFDSDKRTYWTNLPIGLEPRNGVGLGSMTDEQRVKLHILLSELYSSQGYLKATGIMHLDKILKDYFDIPKLEWGHENYFLAFWGKPSEEGNWGFKLGGHHLSINFTFSDMELTATPFFIGTDPAEVRASIYSGWRVLGEEEDLGFLLMNSMSEDQLNETILEREIPKDIITNPNSEQRLTEFWGIKADRLDEYQFSLLKRIIEEYTHNLDHELAHKEMEKIEDAGYENIYFSWIGDTTDNDFFYYLVHGPTFIIEFDNAKNHVHSIWRTKGNDFGEDLLKDHLENSPHHQDDH